MSLPGSSTLIAPLLNDFRQAMDLLDRFDRDDLPEGGRTLTDQAAITPTEARAAIAHLRQDIFGNKPAGLFGNEKDHGLDAVLAALYQTFGGDELYPSVEEKAANLLYLIIKDHPFSDGNKRIGSFLFVWFLHRHGLLYRDDDHDTASLRLAPNALVPLALLTARSEPRDKNLYISLIVNLVGQDLNPR